MDASSSPAGASDGGTAPSWIAELPPVSVRCDTTSGTELYEQRIEPLFAEDRVSSCNECHLSGLDLKLFLRDTPCETMSCMVSRGLVNPAAPDDSLVLQWIARATPQSSLITKEIVMEEYQGFREWIHFSAECEDCVSVSCPGTADAGAFCPRDPEPRPGYRPEAYDPKGCDDDALLEVFRSTVYASRGRCSPCHFNDHDFEDYQAPMWLDVTGDCEGASMRTYWNVLDKGYVDIDDPEKSKLLLKPLSEELGGVEHGGHDKFYSTTEDQGYLNFAYFINRYAECRQ